MDSPEITEPDGALPVRDVAAEGFALAGKRSWRRAVRSWLAEHDFDQYAGDRFDSLPAIERTRLLLELTRQRPGCRVVVLDQPDRHGGGPSTWHPLAEREAARGSAVIVLCTPHSAATLTDARVGAHAVDHDDGGR